MTTISLKTERAVAATKKFTVVKDQKINSVSNTKAQQISDLKQGLKEALLISQGKMEAPPFSTLWDE